MNRVTLIGRLGRDPEVKHAQSGAVANLAVATTERWTDKNSGERKEKTEWHRIVIWGKLAEIAGDRLRKGDKVFVEGKLQTRKWTDQSGQDKYATEVVLQGFGGTLEMFAGRNGDGGGGGGYRAATPSGAALPEFDDGIPF